MKGKGLGISILLDPSTQVWAKEGMIDASSALDLPSKQELTERAKAFIESLQVSDAKIKEIEQQTIEQHRSFLWFDVRRYHLTASLFGDVLCR